MTNVERYARCETPKPFWTSSDIDHRKADLRSKDSRAVWRGAVGKVLTGVTRWQPTLPHDAFLGGGAAVIAPCYPRRPDEVFGSDRRKKAGVPREIGIGRVASDSDGQRFNGSGLSIRGIVESRRMASTSRDFRLNGPAER